MTTLSPDKQRARDQRRQILARLADGPATFEDLRDVVKCSRARLRGLVVHLVERDVVCSRDVDGATVYERWEDVLARVTAKAAGRGAPVRSHRRDAHQARVVLRPIERSCTSAVSPRCSATATCALTTSRCTPCAPAASTTPW